MMIVYVATWPRCGNSVLRDLFWLNWGITVTDPYMPAAGQETWQRIMTGKHGIVIDQDEPQIFRLGQKVGLVPGWLSWLTEERRRELAGQPVTYYLKTHEPPYASYLPGETVVQMIRHPLPACWSWHCLSKQDKELAPEFVATRGNGTTLPGYVEFHERWLEARVPLIRVAYEHHFRHPEATVRTLAAYLRLELQTPKVTSFNTMNTMNPVRYRAGKVAGWQGTDEQAAAIWEACAPVAGRLGYRSMTPEPPVRGPAPG
ncbi:sulfotransferase family protein [Geminicoccus roseus]|uniref:sulfotransferase family protein n=1 Tax=Geminicoccus roseus TaxID=404900 RepID=UPI0004831E72|nr:sulfotransferase family protein [Geminicoccus roseus]